MRTILFRGKRIDNGEWAYGFYVHVPLGRFEKDEHMIQTIHKYGKIAQLYDVNSETVGQFTGLTDKNGKKIFEGDICKTYSVDDGFQIERVDFINGSFAFINLVLLPLPVGDMNSDYIEIIGNIYDSPELLGESHDHH